MRHAAWILATALACGARRADAQPAATAALHWVRLPGAEACPDGHTLARSVERHVGRRVFASASEAALSIEGTIAPGRDGRGWRVALTPRDAGVTVGARELSLARDDCASLAEPIALVLSLMVDPDACVGDACAPPAGGAVRAIAAPTAAPARTAAALRVTRWTALVSGGASLWGLLPAAAPSVGLGVTWRPRRAPVALDVTVAALLPAESVVPWNAAITVRHAGAVATIGGCASPFADLRAFACLGVMAGFAEASARGAVDPQRAVRALLAATVRAGFEVPLGGPVVLRFVPSLVVPVIWPAYTIAAREDARATPLAREVAPVAALGGSFEAMVGVALP